MNFFNSEAEGMVLCALMLDPATIERLSSRVGSADFGSKIHRDLFDDIIRLHRAGTNPDLKAVSSEAKKRGAADAIPDIAMIAGMTYTSANVDHYLEMVKDLSVKRATSAIIDGARARLEQLGEKGIDIANGIENEISSVVLGDCANGYKNAGGYINSVAEQVQWNIKTRGQIKGVDSHFESLRGITGFRDGEYIIIAARPSVGKTALALNLIENIAVMRRIPAGFFSVEMTAKQLELRILASMTGYNSWGIDNGLYKSENNVARMEDTMMEIGNAPLWIDETSGIKISELKAKARRMVHVDKCKIIMIDYMSLIDAEQPRIPRHEQVAVISREVKGMAKELKIPIIMLSQLVRDSEGKRPNLANLAESRSLEQDADVVMFLHRDKECTDDKIPTELIVAKNRNGPTGVCNLIYIPRLTKFIEKPEVQND